MSTIELISILALWLTVLAPVYGLTLVTYRTTIKTATKVDNIERFLFKDE